jgi:hypothetical protein
MTRDNEWAMARHTGEMQNRHGRGRICLLLAGLVFWRSQFADTEIKESRQLCGGKHRPIRRATSKVAAVPACTVARLKRQHVNSPKHNSAATYLRHPTVV